MTTSGWRRGGALALGILFLAACSENVDLFSSLDEQNQPELATVMAGSVVDKDQALEVQIEYPSDESSRATSMRVELRDTAGTVHGTVTFDATELAEPVLPAVEFFQLSDGVYLLVTEAWINDQPLFSDQRQIFVTSTPPRIESVTIHPTSIRREMQALAVADIGYAMSTRPYLRWIFDGGVVAEGYLEDGLDRAIIDGAERNAGAYPVSLEVYPWGVDEGTMIDGSTTITSDSDVVIREELQPTAPDFAQRTPGTVVRYFSFDGTRRAWTDASDETVEATVEGDAFLDLVSGALGVQVPAQAMVSASIPVPESDDTVHLVEMRIASSPGVGSSFGAPLISIDADESVPILIENGMLVAYPPGGSPMPLAPAPGDRELSTLQLMVQNRDGELSLVSPTDTSGAWDTIPLGKDRREIAVSVSGHESHHVFIDRITVTALSNDELRTQRIDRARQRFLTSFDTELRAWAVAAPEGWTERSAELRDYPRAQESITIGEAAVSRVRVLMPDGGAVIVRASDDSAAAMILQRSGAALELSDAQAPEEILSRVELPTEAGRFALHRLDVRRADAQDEDPSAALIRGETEEGEERITVRLPAAFRTARITIEPVAADYPVWVGR